MAVFLVPNLKFCFQFLWLKNPRRFSNRLGFLFLKKFKMKKVIITLAAMFIINICYAQNAIDTSIKKVINVSKLRPTGKCYTDKLGVKYPVYINVSDRLFIVLTNGKGQYKKYIF